MVYALMLLAPVALFSWIDILAAKKGKGIGWILLIPIVNVAIVVFGQLSAGRFSFWDFLVIIGTILMGIATSKKTSQFIEGKVENDTKATADTAETKETTPLEVKEDRVSYFKKKYQDTPDKKLKKILDSPDYLEVTKQAVRQILDEREEQASQRKASPEALSTIAEENPPAAETEYPPIIPDVKYCRMCGKELVPDSKFCRKCGFKLS